MLDIDTSTIDFLVTDTMADEADQLLATGLAQVDAVFASLGDRRIERVVFVACGSPLCACETAAMLLTQYSTVPCLTTSGWDFLDRTPAGLDETTLVVGVSDSGNTEEVAKSLVAARAAGAVTVAVTKDATGNLVADAAEHVVAYGGSAIWVMHCLIGYAFAIAVIDSHGGHPEIDALRADLPRLPGVLRRLVAEQEGPAKERAARAVAWPFVYTVAGGNLVPLGYKEGIITMLEFTWTHGAALNASEFRHGPLEVVEQGVPYVFLLGTDGSRHTTQRCIDFVTKLTDDVLVFDAAELETGLHPALDPIALFVPLEYFYLHLSLAKDHNPDDRRYYGGLVAY